MQHYKVWICGATVAAAWVGWGPAITLADDVRDAASARGAMHNADEPPAAHVESRTPADQPVVSSDAENTELNQRDRSGETVTPPDQGGSKRDRELAASIRHTVVKDKSLSVSAHNIKIVVQNGAVTLRGPVKSEREHQRVIAAVRRATKSARINDKLDVAAR